MGGGRHNIIMGPPSFMGAEGDAERERERERAWHGNFI
jgi:hypothetical protein